jgi:hypothetical protein
MRKALHDNEEGFLTFKDGKINIWDSRDIEIFIEAANKGLELLRRMRNSYREKNIVESNDENEHELPEIFRKSHYYAGIPHINEEESFCLAVNDWMYEYVDQGKATDEMVEELNSFSSKIRYRHVLMPSEDGEPYWEYIADLDRQLDPAEAAAFGFSQMLAIGGLKMVKRCEMPDCGHYFLGRSNAKWCSKACGSKYRVRQKRKRDAW